MLQFAIIEIKSLLFYKLCLIARGIFLFSLGLMMFIMLLGNIDSIKEIVREIASIPIIRYLILTDVLISIPLFIFYSALYALEDNYREIGDFIINSESCMIQLFDGTSYLLNENTVDTIRIEYNEARYSNAFKITGAPLTMRMGYTNTISFIQEKKQYSFRFLSTDEQDKNKIKEVISQSELLRKIVKLQ
jgi:hypothetical protein